MHTTCCATILLAIVDDTFALPLPTGIAWALSPTSNRFKVFPLCRLGLGRQSICNSLNRRRRRSTGQWSRRRQKRWLEGGDGGHGFATGGYRRYGAQVVPLVQRHSRCVWGGQLVVRVTVRSNNLVFYQPLAFDVRKARSGGPEQSWLTGG